MKKAYIILIFFILLSACSDKKSNDVAADFINKPGSLKKFGIPANLSSIQFNSVIYNCNYGIIRNTAVNNVSNIGIALSDNPDPALETFNLKIYFPGTVIPTTKTISATDTIIKIRIRNNTSENFTEYSGLTGGPITLTFSNETINSYTKYTIVSGSGEGISVGTYDLRDFNIEAILSN